MSLRPNNLKADIHINNKKSYLKKKGSWLISYKISTSANTTELHGTFRNLSSINGKRGLTLFAKKVSKNAKLKRQLLQSSRKRRKRKIKIILDYLQIKNNYKILFECWKKSILITTYQLLVLFFQIRKVRIARRWSIKVRRMRRGQSWLSLLEISSKI